MSQIMTGKVTKGTGHMLLGGKASAEAAPARNAIRMRRHPQASTMVWARRVIVTVVISAAVRRGKA